MQVDFYLLGGTPVERVLPELAERALAIGKRMLVVSASENQRAMLDAKLWTFSPASFLPHGLAGGDADAVQPVLISECPKPANGAPFLALADGVWREQAFDFERAFYLFGPDRIDEARAVWRALETREDIDNRFWKQDEAGKWRRGP